jgi:hypothetical protein
LRSPLPELLTLRESTSAFPASGDGVYIALLSFAEQRGIKMSEGWALVVKEIHETAFWKTGLE